MLCILLRDLLRVAGLTRTLDGTLILAKVDESGSEARPVGNAREKQLRSLVKLVLEALLSDFENIRDVGHAQEILHVVQAIRLGVCVRKLGIDLGLAEVFTGHLKEADEIVVLAGAVCNLDELGVVGGILRLDVGVYDK